MKNPKTVCIALGVLHALIMTAFAMGPELSPLMVLIVDAPVAYFTKDLSSPVAALGIPIVACSVLYSALIFLAGDLIAKRSPREPIQAAETTRGK